MTDNIQIETMNQNEEAQEGLIFDEEDGNDQSNDFVIDEENLEIPGTGTDLSSYRETVGSKATSFKSKKRKRPPVHDASGSYNKKVVTGDGVVVGVVEEEQEWSEDEDVENDENDLPIEDVYDFLVDIESPLDFSEWIKNTGNMLEEGTIQIENTKDCQGLAIQCLHPSNSLFVSSKFEANVLCPLIPKQKAENEENTEEDQLPKLKCFGVKFEELRIYIGAMNKNSRLRIYRRKNDEWIYLQSGVDAGIPNSKKVEIKIPDLEFGLPKPIPSTLITHSFTIVLGVSVMKDFIKAANALQAEKINFSIWMPKSRNTSTEVLFCKLSSIGPKDGNITTTFCCVCDRSNEENKKSEDNDSTENRMTNGTVIKLSEDVVEEFKLKKADKKCEGTYDLTYITQIIAPMSKICKINLANEEKSPMILQYNWSDNTYVRFVLAKSLEDE